MKPANPLLASLLALAFTTTTSAEPKSPERQVHGTTITSSKDPAVQVTLPAAAQYAGAARWDLYQVADAEVHVFVEADAARRVQRLYWVQFESYLPDNTYVYEYPFTESTTHAGRKFDVHAYFGANDKPLRPGSDFERVRDLVKEAGFQYPGETMNVRLVHLLDDAKRQELMFIYVEDLGLAKVTVEELELPANQARWQALKAGLIERARERIQLQF